MVGASKYGGTRTVATYIPRSGIANSSDRVRNATAPRACTCTVNSAVKALKGEKLPKITDTGFYYYDKTNIADPKVAAVLYD